MREHTAAEKREMAQTLATMAERATTMEPVHLHDAHRLSEGVYYGPLPLEILTRTVDVPRRAEDTATGYQRACDPKRVVAIADALAAGRTVPTTLLLAAREGAAFVHDARNKRLSFVPVPGAFALVDGQHRLAGWTRWAEATGAKNVRLLCSIHTGLDASAEARLFCDVNGLQEGVSRALLAEVAELARTETAKGAQYRTLFDAMAGTGVLAPHLDPLGTARGKLARPAFQSCMAKAFTGRTTKALDPARREARVQAYLRAWADELPATLPLSRAAVLGGVMDALDDVVEYALRGGNGAGLDPLRVAVHALVSAVPAKPTRRELAEAIREAVPSLEGADELAV